MLATPSIDKVKNVKIDTTIVVASTFCKYNFQSYPPLKADQKNAKKIFPLAFLLLKLPCLYSIIYPANYIANYFVFGILIHDFVVKTLVYFDLAIFR